MKIFSVSIKYDLVVKIDDDIIDSVDDNWRKTFYNLRNENEIVEHIVYNMVVNRLNLSQIDGFADKDNSQVELIFDDYYTSSEKESP